MTEIELSGLELYGYHGVLEEERRDGQPFVFDLWLELPDGAGASDDLADTVDYRQIASLVREISDGRQFQLLEALAAAVADALVARFEPIQRARVRVKKPAVQLDPPVSYSAVTVERP